MDTWVIFIGAVLAIAGAVNTIGAAGEKIVKIIKAAKAPNDELGDRVSVLETTTKELQDEATRIQKRLDKHDDGNRVTQIAILALLEHGIDGNNIDAMLSARGELQKYLINK